MIRSIQRGTLVEMLLNSLEAERYVRRPLLLEIIGELSASNRFEPARSEASLLLARLERGEMTDAELARGIDDVRAAISRPLAMDPPYRPTPRSASR